MPSALHETTDSEPMSEQIETYTRTWLGLGLALGLGLGLAGVRVGLRVSLQVGQVAQKPSALRLHLAPATLTLAAARGAIGRAARALG